MPIRVELSDGRVVTVETDDPQEAAQAAHTFQQRNPARSNAPGAPRPRLPVGGVNFETADDAARSFASGIPQGVTGFLGQIGDVPRMIEDAATMGAQLRGMPEAQARQAVAPAARALTTMARGAVMPFVPLPLANAVQGQAPTSQALNEQVQRVTGPYHQPQTRVGQYANTIGQFAGGALMPGSLAARTARTVLPAVASETAGQMTQGTPLETPARIAGGIFGGVGTEALISANARRASARPAAATMQAEQDFAPLTRGERLAVSRDNRGVADTRALATEHDLRHGTGSGRAQSLLSGFDADRAELLRQNALRRTIGEPEYPDANAAGTALAEQLRSQRQGLRELESAQYERAFAGMEQEAVPAPVGPNRPNSLGPVSRAASQAAESQAIDFRSLPAGVRRTLSLLDERIEAGAATQAYVERARQELNRELTTARNAGDGATANRITSVIRAMDEWRATLPRNQAVVQMTDEARAMHQEAQRLYGEQPNADLATGHIGDTDIGGRTLERIIGTDLSGASVLDAILGGSVKPSQQALAAVRAIRRLPQRRFNNPGTPEGQYAPEVQALREGFMHRLLSPLDEYIRRTQTEGPARAGVLPARRLANDLDTVLNKSGKEVIEQLFSPQEIAELHRLQRHLQTMAPPPGSAPVSSPAMLRTISGMVSRVLNTVTVGGANLVGEAVKPLLSEATATQAIRPIQPPRPATQPISPLFYTAPASGSANRRRQR